MVVEYLERDHAAFRSAPDHLARAERALLAHGLSGATTFRAEFDRERLRSLIGGDAFATLFTDVSEHGRDPSRYDTYEGDLDQERIALLSALLAAEDLGGRESPHNYIRSIRLLDGSGRTLLRIGDHNTFYVFDLPPDERPALIEDLQDIGLPGDVIKPVDIELDRLEP